jgi:1-acyl-sn-glycerol-3-phosphate acyltransferase
LKTLWWYFIKSWVKTSLFFYSKKIRVEGRENIPKKGAVLFMVNHPNGLLDPLVVAVNNPRILHFLVQAAVFRNPTVRKILGTLNLMPIYRIRDGIRGLDRNQEIFENCYSIFKKKSAIMIFPEGSHDRRRTVRPLSKGFTRILYGALERNPEIEIQIVPVGLTYQNPSIFPGNVVVRYGKPILANPYQDQQNQVAKTKELKELISNRLKELSVHIPADDNYQSKLSDLDNANVDFTKVNKVNEMIASGKIEERKRPIHLFAFLKPLIILNSLIPWLVWKSVDRKNDEFEFIDTFRFGFNTFLIPIFYILQTCLVSYFLDWKTAGIYLGSSLLLVLLYSKTHPSSAGSITQ